MRSKRSVARGPSRRTPTAAFREAVRAEYFARRLFDPRFMRQIEEASRPMIPAALGADREDVLENALLRAYDRREQFHGKSEGDLKRWVLRIVSNLARDHLRAKRRRPDMRGLSEAQDLAAGGDEAGSGEPVKRVVREILEKLPSADRDVLLLRLGRGMSARETAELLGEEGISEPAVRMRLFRAHRRFLGLLREAGLEPRSQEN